jgi:UPF0755 protein
MTNIKQLFKAIGLCLALTLVAVNLHNTFFLIDYRAKSSTEKVEVIIENGDSGLVIANKLYEAGVVKTAKIFYRIALSQKRSNGISPGVHSIDTKISANSAMDQLLDGKRNRGLLGFAEGLRVYEVLAILEKSDLLTGKYSGTISPNEKYETNNLEGFLFPAQYAFAPNTTVDKAISAMLQRFEAAAVDSELEKCYSGYTPYQCLIIASIAQAEGDNQDYSKIARVIYNRLRIGMPLQMNTTVEYAAKLRGQIRMSYKQLEINSKYNTYKYRGLTPTPIGNPGEAAMKAAVNPASGDWLYFITVKPKDTRFTSSITEFNIWANEFRANEKAGLFK